MPKNKNIIFFDFRLVLLDRITNYDNFEVNLEF